MVDQIINGYVRNPIKDGVGELPGTTGELFPATMQLAPAKVAIRIATNFENNPAFADAVAELYTKIRTNVNGHRTYTTDSITSILGQHAFAYAWYVSQCTLLNAYAACGKLRVANPEKFVAQFQYKGLEATPGIGYYQEDNNNSVLYNETLSTLRDKVAEVGRLMDVCIVPIGLRNLIDSYFNKYLLTTKDVEAPEAFIQTYVYDSILSKGRMEDVNEATDKIKTSILRTPGVDPADVAQFVSDALQTGIGTGRVIPYSDKPSDAFKYDEYLLSCMANVTHAKSEAANGVYVTDFSYSTVYAEPMVYFHGNPNKLETIAGIIFDDTDPGNGNAFPNHYIQSNALFSIAQLRLCRWWNKAATGFAITDIEGSHDCYVNTASSTTAGESYIVQAFINLMLLTNGGLDGLLPTVSVQDPGAADPDHWGLLPMRTDHNPNCWSTVKLASKQHELVQKAVIGTISVAERRRTPSKNYDRKPRENTDQRNS